MLDHAILRSNRLIAITVVTLISIALSWDIPNIGEIPPTVVLAERLGLSSLTSLDPSLLLTYLNVGLAIALIAGIEGLLTGRVATEMAQKQNGEAVPFYPNKEMIAQGINNMLLPFFGTVPAGGAIARSTVNVIKWCRHQTCKLHQRVNALSRGAVLRNDHWANTHCGTRWRRDYDC